MFLCAYSCLTAKHFCAIVTSNFYTKLNKADFHWAQDYQTFIKQITKSWYIKSLCYYIKVIFTL